MSDIRSIERSRRWSTGCVEEVLDDDFVSLVRRISLGTVEQSIGIKLPTVEINTAMKTNENEADRHMMIQKLYTEEEFIEKHVKDQELLAIRGFQVENFDNTSDSLFPDEHPIQMEAVQRTAEEVSDVDDNYLSEPDFEPDAYQIEQEIERVHEYDFQESKPAYSIWMPVSSSEDFRSEGFSAPPGYNMEKFIRNLFHESTEVNAKLDEKDELTLNDQKPSRYNDLIGLEIGNQEPFANTVEPLRVAVFDEPIVKAIMYSDVEMFFDEVCRTIEMCEKECVCCMKCSSTRRSEHNLLHIAFAASTVEFIRSIVVEEEFCKKFEQYHQNPHNASGHYKCQVKKWMEGTYFNATPIRVAAELNRIDVVNMALNNFSDDKTIMCLRNDWRSLLGSLVYHSALDQIESQLLKRIFDVTTKKQIQHALDVAAVVGCQRSNEIIRNNLPAGVRKDENELVSQRKFVYSEKSAIEIIPGIHLNLGLGDEDKYVSCDPTLSHILAQHGNTEQFEKLDAAEKHQLDAYGWSPLVYLLSCPDEFVEKELHGYRSARREDLFTFISQTIVQNRVNLMDEALKITFSNPENFTKRRNNVYESYGLPEYVPLPMETALSRTGDMVIVQRITEFYSRQDTYAMQIIKTDALRCMKSIQDKASRPHISGHIRLAVFFLLKKFIDLQSIDFMEIMTIYAASFKEDPVEDYIMKHFIEAPSHCNSHHASHRPLSWQEAFDTAMKADIDPCFECPMNILEINEPKEATTLKSILTTPEKSKANRKKKEARSNVSVSSQLKMINSLTEAITAFEEMQIKTDRE